MDFANYTEEETTRMLSRYNGTGDEAAEYGDAVNNLALIFAEYA